MKTFYLSILISIISLTTIFSRNPREIISINKGWKFHLGDAADVDKDFRYGSSMNLQFAKAEPAPYGGHSIPSTIMKFNDKNWKSVTLPHDWTIELPYDSKQHKMFGNRYGYKPVGREYPKTSIGWYRKKFPISKSDEGKKIIVEFDGIFRDSQIWVNGFYIGRHWSGYTGFRFDISDYLNYGKENIIAVRVDATIHEGWFYEGSGINKPVRLIKSNTTNIKFGSPYITTSSKGNNSKVIISTEVENYTEGLSVHYKIIAADGREVAFGYSDIDKPGINDINISLNNPQKWSVDSPYRYKLICELKSGNNIIDNKEVQFGIREVEFSATKGFLLNGKQLKLKGVCIHQNFAGVGSAMPEELHYYRLRMLKEMGVNAVRSHYPFSPLMLNACDSLGMLVMDETRLAASTPEAMDQLEEMVIRDRNHPSIIIWSMANEEGGIQRAVVGKKVMKKMVEYTHKLDPSRKVTAGVNAWGSKVDFGFSQEIDVMGFNYSLKFIDEYHKNHPDQPIIGTEVSNASVTREVYPYGNNKIVIPTDGVGAYFAKEGHDDSKFDGHIAANNMKSYSGAFDSWKFYDEREYLAGSFFWTGFDYKGETWPNKYPNNSSQFGAIDLCGNPKDAYFYYKSWWTDEPTVKVASHWNWKGLEGKKIKLPVFSNCDKVSIYLNGRKKATKVVPENGHVEFDIKYKKGTLKAVGFNKGEKSAKYIIKTSDTPYSVRLKAHKSTLKATGEDISVISIEVVDKKGNLVPYANNKLTFKTTGNIEFLGNGNGNPSCLELDIDQSRSAFNGRAMVIVRSNEKAGKGFLEVSGEGLQTSGSIKIDVK